MRLGFNLLLLALATKACLFGLKPEPKHCGKICTERLCDKKHTYRWNLYVVLEDPKQGIFDLPRLCFGTIIASNLILTSMRCLIEDNTFQVFETWNSFSFLSINNISRVKVIPSAPIYNEDGDYMSFQIEKVFLSQRYVVSKSVNSFRENDVAVIVLKGNLFSVKSNSSIQYVPVCFGDDGTEYKQFQLYTVRANNPENIKYRPPPWNVNKTCMPNQTVKTPIESSAKNVLEIVPGELVSLDKCNAVFDLKNNDAPDTDSETTLCFRFHGGHQLLTGQPLLASSDPVTPDTTPNCLIGISKFGTAFFTNSNKDGYNYAYFTNILRKRNQAKFCKDDSTNEVPVSRMAEISYAWNKPGSNITRDISLNCACGLLSNGEPTETSLVFDELMGWITLVRVQRGLDTTDCTGSLINDRNVIVAAHCLLLNNKLTINDFPPADFVNLANVQIFFDVINRSNLTAAKQKQIAKIRTHPGFGKHWIYDIAIVTLVEPVKFATCGDGRRPICLPDITTYEGHIAYGWRAYDSNGDISYWDYLNQEKYHTVFNCKSLTINGAKMQPDKKVCYHHSGDPNQLFSLPQGVNNEPLYAMSKSYQWTLLGTGSWRSEGINSVPHDYDDSISEEFGSIGVYYNLQEMDGFVDYYANLDGAKWCNERLVIT